jgi:hypothetical protein
MMVPWRLRPAKNGVLCFDVQGPYLSSDLYRLLEVKTRQMHVNSGANENSLRKKCEAPILETPQCIEHETFTGSIGTKSNSHKSY